MATTKPKKEPKKRALDLTKVLSAVDNKNYEFYDNLTAAELKEFSPSIKNNVTLTNIFERQLLLAKKIISTLHEDLQYDYNLVIEQLD